MIGSPPSCVIWVSVAEKLPGAVGAKPTVTVHVAPAGTVRFTHVLPDTKNWPRFAPPHTPGLNRIGPPLMVMLTLSVVRP